jgi:hypothetical protein
MESLFKIGGGLMWAVLGKIAEKLPADLAKDLNCDSAMIDAMVTAAIEYKEKNPYEMSIDEQLAALFNANDEEKWGMSEEDFNRLDDTAPAWPKGRHAYRSFRIRFGKGGEGVARTFEAHVARIQRVFGEEGCWRWEHLHSGSVPYEGEPVECLRLLAGDHTHKPVIEWIITDLGMHRKRDSVTAVRDSRSLADELLVIAWLFPDMIRAIDCDKFPGLFAAGYEVNSPVHDVEAWQRVVLVNFDRGNCRMLISARERNRADSIYSVPVLRK